MSFHFVGGGYSGGSWVYVKPAGAIMCRELVVDPRRSLVEAHKHVLTTTVCRNVLWKVVWRNASAYFTVVRNVALKFIERWLLCGFYSGLSFGC